MIVETGVAKFVAAGGGLVSSVVLIAGFSGGAKYAATSSDVTTFTNAVCSYASPTAANATLGMSPPGLGLTSDQIANAQIIVDVGAALGLPPRGAEIAVATALQESRLDSSTVGDHGHAFGLFQQHPDSGWGTRSQVTTPNYAARAFYELLVKVHDWQTMPLTRAAAIVQRPREDLRGDYAKHEPLAKKLVAALRRQSATIASEVSVSEGKGLGLSSGEQARLRTSIETAAALGVPRQAVVADIRSALVRKTAASGIDPTEIEKRAEKVVTTIAGQLCAGFSATLGETSDGLGAGASRGATAVGAALQMRGIPYSWGGGGPSGPGYGIGRGAKTKGFDCSGLAEYAWSKAGVRIGGHTSVQWNTGSHVPRTQIRPGDLIFFAYNPRNPATIHHVGIAIDSTRMVHAAFTGSTVRVDTWVGVPGREGEFIGAVRPS